jgi:uncharacterized protein (DUF427 family)
MKASSTEPCARQVLPEKRPRNRQSRTSVTRLLQCSPNVRSFREHSRRATPRRRSRGSVDPFCGKISHTSPQTALSPKNLQLRARIESQERVAGVMIAMRPPQLEPGQECVWDYPRPSRLERSDHLVRIEFAGLEIARSARTGRVLETTHPPVFYVPRDDIAVDALRPADGSSLCEWKGRATYYDLIVGDRVAERAAWTYLEPYPHYAALANSVAFIGPFKGARGTEGW